MNGKNIKKHLNNKLRDWILNIDDENIKKIIKDNVIVTGGAIVSLLTGEKLTTMMFISEQKKRAWLWRHTMSENGMKCIRTNRFQ